MSRVSWIRGSIAGPLMAGVLCAAAAGIAHAIEIYKWVDENGVTHYSNIKPSGVKWQLVTENKVSVIPGNRIGAEAARAAERERATAGRGSPEDTAIQNEVEAQTRAQRRERRLRDCQRNNGVECEREVDTELRAEGVQEGRGVIRTVPPPVTVVPAAPVTSSSAPTSPASALR
jgi:hypothetical protein